LGPGTVFKVDKTGKFTRLHTFDGGAGGDVPGYGSLFLDAKGNVYGTTMYGGNSTSSCPITYPYMGCGVVFKITP
jgi:hypothetical protein